jgi:pyruvate-formate lyase-activating enzyme
MTPSPDCLETAMKKSALAHLTFFGLTTVAFKREKPILGTIILTDACNLSCKHCSVNNIEAALYPYREIQSQMRLLFDSGVRILFFCGGETFLWGDEGKTVRNLVVEAKTMGFYLVNVVTNGTHTLDLPEADLILLSLDGDETCHNEIRGDTYGTILRNIALASSPNICLYMAINRLNKDSIPSVCEVARAQQNVKAVSFNFHTPYPDTRSLSLSKAEKAACCETIGHMIDLGYPIFNLRSAFPFIVENSFPTPCHQCVVIEKGDLWVCGRCIDVEGLCEECGYFFAAEYSLAFKGDLRVAWEMLRTYPRFLKEAS